MKLIVRNLYNNTERSYDIDKMYDFDVLAKDFGPHITSIAGEFKSVRPALDAISEYLSNAHLEAEVIDDQDSEEIYDPNIQQQDKETKDPKSAVDLKDLLETYDNAEFVNIPDMHVINSATHRWDK